MNKHDIIEYASQFTDRYLSAADKYKREVDCLDLQFRHSMLPMRSGDTLAGRIRELPLGLLPQSSCGVGYYINESIFSAYNSDSGLSASEREKSAELLTFWNGERTNEKIAAEYPKEWFDIFVHNVPYTTPTVSFALYRISGIQMDPTKLLKNGIGGLLDILSRKREVNPAFYDGLSGALRLLSEVCLRYADEATQKARTAVTEAEKSELDRVAENLRHISSRKPDTFWQALQLSYLFMTLSGTWNYGRMDQYLGEYLKTDIDSGIITQQQALKLISDTWSLIEERNNVFDSRVILGGSDRSAGADMFAMLAMEATRIRKGVVPQLTLRCFQGMDPALLDKALETIGEGTTFPMLYNDEVNIPAVTRAFGVDPDTAQKYVPFGCGEYVICNQSIGTPSGTINLLFGLNDTLYGRRSELFTTAESFDEFYGRYIREMKKTVCCLSLQEKLEYDVCAREFPSLFFSILFDDCIENGAALLDGGLRYLGGTLETYGNINTADSLTAIKRVVFADHEVSAQTLSDALKNNFEGYDTLRKSLLAQPKYGNDDDTADSMAVRLHRDICNAIRDSAEEAGLDSYLAVVINNSLNSTFGESTGASADGRLAHTYMANANNPVGGMDTHGITAMLNSLVKLDTGIHAGAVQNMRFSGEMFSAMLSKTKGLLKAYFDNGGAQTMITVLNRGDLEAAMKEPEKYQDLVVRVGGFSAHFVELEKEVQRELISRTLY